ncbi:discoidin, CUB and LCCL domain-containing protein 1 [Centroberyx affinis]|uniref:discoidin, CUB and LCCL domain-containing protein 1 n=2 Tax=Centroberyx affinis TaxID=166261 RepID=UPI003A5BC7E9
MTVWMYRTISDSLPGFLVALWILYTQGEKLDDGCGHALLGPDSGVLSSKNYPSTYPNNTWCEWHLRVPAGNQLVLKFGDLDIEAQDCQSSYVRIRKGYGAEHVYGSFCGSLKSYPRELHTDSSQLIVQFRSGNHISGRGFLLSYSTTSHRDLLTCLDRGSYFSAPKYRKYCPAGCRGVEGDVSGDVSHGYRHTSVLCKAAVHAGVIQDKKGGWVSVESRKGLSHYPASRANGVQSKHGSLSDSLFTFISNECQNQSVLRPAAITASSWWRQGVEARPPNSSTHIQAQDRDRGQAQAPAEPRTSTPTWVAEQNGSMQWLQLDLGEKKKIIGIVTEGSTWLQMDYYVRSYRIEVKEKSRWRAYAPINATDYQVSTGGNQDSVQQSKTSLHPPIVARFLRLIPLSWNQGIAMAVQLLGCPHIRGRLPPILTPPTQPRPMVNQGITQPVASHDDLVKLAIIIVPTVLSLLLLLTGICVFKMLHKRQTKDQSYGSSEEEKTGCWKQMKQPFARHQSTEFTISYSSEKDPMHKLDFTSTMAEYQQPLMIGMGTVSRKGSTFRPMDADTKDDATDPATHYDYLHTANQYALPLTNQEPEYATPIVERHAFRKDNFLSDAGNYSVPGAVLSRGSEGACRNPGAGGSGDYQTPQVKNSDRAEGGYDCPKASQSHSQAQRPHDGHSDYQQPQAKASVLDSYSTPKDCSRSPEDVLQP